MGCLPLFLFLSLSLCVAVWLCVGVSEEGSTRKVLTPQNEKPCGDVCLPHSSTLGVLFHPLTLSDQEVVTRATESNGSGPMNWIPSFSDSFFSLGLSFLVDLTWG